MSCRKAERWLLTSFDRELPEEARNSLAEHLRACPECRKRAGEYGALRDRLSAVRAPEPLPRFWERLETRIGENSLSAAGVLWTRLWARAIPVSLSLIAGFFAATLFLLPSSRSADLSGSEVLLLTEGNPIADTAPIIEENQRDVRNLRVLFAADERPVGKR